MKQTMRDPEITRIQVSDPAFERDGLRNVTVYSRALQGRADVSLFVPDGLQTLSSVPIVILLHGVYGSHWAWFLQGGAHVTARALMEQRKIRKMVIAAPSDGLRGDGTGYLRWGAQNYEAWICEDLIGCLDSLFSNAGRSVEIFIAGLSMGGYGAMRLGAKYPQRFSGISAHSAITVPGQFQEFVRDLTPFKSEPHEELALLYWLLRHRGELPPLRFDCGKDDSLFDANQMLHRRLIESGIPHEFMAFPGGHDWAYWQAHIVDTLMFCEGVLEAKDRR